MTRDDYDRVVFRVHDILDKQGCVMIKAQMRDDASVDLFQAEAQELRLYTDYEISYFGNDPYLLFVVTNSPSYDMHEYAGYILSNLIYCKPQKIQYI